MREQVITPRAGRVGAGSKGRGVAAAQRPGTRAARGGAPKDARRQTFTWKSALPYVPAALKVVLAVALGVLVYLGYRTAVSASFFKVRAVDVAGVTRASREEIRAEVVRLSNAGVWQSDLEVIAEELRGLPWVRDAVVTRVLPSGLRVRVTEREPRVISRTVGGRLVWVDDDGVLLGAATPGEEDFFVRGIDESRTPEAAKRNRARVVVARELARELARAGLTSRVSELNLEDLDDVRVNLAGADAAIEVRLGKEDFPKRLRQGIDVLDAQRQSPRGPYVTYIDVSQGRRAIVGVGSTAQYRPAPAGDAESAEPPAAEPATPAAPEQPAQRPAPAQVVKQKAAPRRPPKPEEKKPDARPPAGAATRPRRVG